MRFYSADNGNLIKFEARVFAYLPYMKYSEVGTAFAGSSGLINQVCLQTMSNPRPPRPSDKKHASPRGGGSGRGLGPEGEDGRGLRVR